MAFTPTPSKSTGASGKYNTYGASTSAAKRRAAQEASKSTTTQDDLIKISPEKIVEGQGQVAIQGNISENVILTDVKTGSTRNYGEPKTEVNAASIAIDKAGVDTFNQSMKAQGYSNAQQLYEGVRNKEVLPTSQGFVFSSRPKQPSNVSEQDIAGSSFAPRTIPSGTTNTDVVPSASFGIYDNVPTGGVGVKSNLPPIEKANRPWYSSVSGQFGKLESVQSSFNSKVKDFNAANPIGVGVVGVAAVNFGFGVGKGVLGAVKLGGDFVKNPLNAAGELPGNIVGGTGEFAVTGVKNLVTGNVVSLAEQSGEAYGFGKVVGVGGKTLKVVGEAPGRVVEVVREGGERVAFNKAVYGTFFTPKNRVAVLDNVPRDVSSNVRVVASPIERISFGGKQVVKGGRSVGLGGVFVETGKPVLFTKESLPRSSDVVRVELVGSERVTANEPGLIRSTGGSVGPSRVGDASSVGFTRSVDLTGAEFERLVGSVPKDQPYFLKFSGEGLSSPDFSASKIVEARVSGFDSVKSGYSSPGGVPRISGPGVGGGGGVGIEDLRFRVGEVVKKALPGSGLEAKYRLLPEGVEFSYYSVAPSGSRTYQFSVFKSYKDLFPNEGKGKGEVISFGDLTSNRVKRSRSENVLGDLSTTSSGGGGVGVLELQKSESKSKTKTVVESLTEKKQKRKSKTKTSFDYLEESRVGSESASATSASGARPVYVFESSKVSFARASSDISSAGSIGGLGKSGFFGVVSSASPSNAVTRSGGVIGIGTGLSSGSGVASLSKPLSAVNPLGKGVVGSGVATRVGSVAGSSVASFASSANSALQSSSAFQAFKVGGKERRIEIPKRSGLFESRDGGSSGLFSVEVRRRGTFKEVGSGLDFESAVKKGYDVVDNSAAATFRVKDRSGGVVGLTAKKGFYSRGGLVIENRSNRISTGGELGEITLKGIRSTSGGRKRGGVGLL